jgi:hypothetical protein
MNQEIIYSDKIQGDEGNYEWSVRFDRNRRYLGISQTCDNNDIQRVLLSPRQVEALRGFLSQQFKPRKRRKLAKA